MGDSKQKAAEAEPVHSSNVIEEPIASHTERKNTVRGILYGGQFSGKLGTADDPLESRADSIANRISSIPISNHLSAAEKNQTNNTRRHLSATEKSFFEPQFGTDLSDVTLNYSSESSRFAKSINARAFTYGSDIHLSKSDINIQSDTGIKTLAHELAHVVQNRQAESDSTVIRREFERTGRVEFSQRYRRDGELRDDAEEIELGVLVRIFYNLQMAELIPESKHLGDDLNSCQRAAMGTIMDEMGVSRGITGCSVPATYEAALRILVTDADDNGRFDIDIDALYRSRLTNLSQTSCVDTSVLERAINAEEDPTDDWLDDQSDNADHSNDIFGQSTQFVNRFGALTDEGDAVRDLDDSYAITDIERNFWRVRNAMRDFVDEGNNSEAVSLAISGANDLFSGGGWAEAAQLMAFGFRAAVDSETLTQQLLSALEEDQHLARVLDETVDSRLTSGLRLGFDSNSDVTIRADGDDFDITLRELVSQVQARQAFVNTVDEAVEGDVSLTPTLEEMTSYMHQLVASTASLEQIKTALRTALTSQFVHSGRGVEYPSYPGASRASNMPGLYSSLSQDGAGRFVIDCDGFVAFARHFLDAGTGRFDFLFMDRRYRDPLRENIYRGSTHALMAVMEPESENGFIINNNRVEGDFTYDRNATGMELYSSIGVGLRSMGYTTQYTHIFIAPNQSIYDGGNDPNRWE